MSNRREEIMLNIGWKEYQQIHDIIGERLKTLEDQAFTWLEEILEEASKEFGKSENTLLPKTPSAKRRQRRKRSSIGSISRRKIQTEEEEDDYVQQKNSRATRQTRKRTPAAADVSDDDESASKVIIVEDGVDGVKEAPVGRRTRAASRAATTSRARNTRANKTKKKNKSEEPVFNLSKTLSSENNELVTKTPENRVPPLPITANSLEDTCKTPDNRIESVKTPDTIVRTSFVEIEEWSQSANVGVIASCNRLQLPQAAVSHKTCKTPIRNFDSMNVKEKAHAYEEIILISPLSNGKNANSNALETLTPRRSPVTPKTPTTVTRKSVSPKTPELSSSAKVPAEKRQSQKKDADSISQTVETPVSERNSERSVSPRKPSPRKSLRVSVKRASLKCGKILPSAEKRLEIHEASKSGRPRTRLRLKKKTKETETTSSETADTASTNTEEEQTTDDDKDDQIRTNDNQDNGEKLSRCQDDDDENNADVSDMEMDDEPEPVKAKSTRTKTRAVHDNNQGEEQVKSSTRTKTRHASKAESHQTKTGTDSAFSSEEKTEEECVEITEERNYTKVRTSDSAIMGQEPENLGDNKDSGLGTRSGVSSPCSMEEDKPRVTRSKMRKPPVKPSVAMDTDDSDGAFTSPKSMVPRMTRTKTRKRQHEEVSDNESRQSKRSCTETSILAGNDTASTQDEESSDGCISPVCPADKVVRPYAKSFIHNLKSTSVKPVNLNPGLVRSFIQRNSPAPKPTLKEIQEKKKKELLEKDRKEKERLKKREEEHRMKMEEIRRKREEKMKKVQEMREMKKNQEKEQKMLLEKKLAEKRQLTCKLKEERIKEERQKQKIRLQKAEEAEERRKQENEERQKKLKEQLEAEKLHAEMLQRKKDMEEQERQKKIAEERQREKERLLELEKEREVEAEKLRLAEEEKKKEWQKKKEERERVLAQERAEKERQELERKKERDMQIKREMEKLREQEKLRLAEEERKKEQERQHDEEVRKLVEKHNQQVAEKLTQSTQEKALPKPNLNTTQTLNSSGKKDSYEMTPDKIPKPSTFENYDITDLNSGDETDDDEAPRKKIPEWALGQSFKAQLIKQLYNPPDLNILFPPMEPPDLNMLFERKRAKWNKRTSSAHWPSPIPKTWDAVRY